MKRGFLSLGGRGGGRGVKEKQRVFADVSAKEHDRAIEDMTSSSNLIDDNVKVCGVDSGPVTPSVTTCLDNVGNTLGNEASNLTSSPNGNSLTPISFATLVKGDTSRKVVNFRTLVTQAGNGTDVVISKESVCVVNKRLNNTVYGFFLGKHVAYPVVKNYIKNNWDKFGHVKSMMIFSLSLGLNTGCSMTFPLLFLRKSLSAIATKLSKPFMLDSYTVAMCTDSRGRDSYARALGYTLNTVRVEYEWTPPRCSGCKVFGHILDDFPKKIVSDISKFKDAASTCSWTSSWLETQVYFCLSSVFTKKAENTNGNPKVPTANKATTTLNSLEALMRINNLERKMLNGKLVLVDYDWKPLETE
ncbi:hypothetical protein Tco_0675694, partial [Tanacetum coccineum]